MDGTTGGTSWSARPPAPRRRARRRRRGAAPLPRRQLRALRAAVRGRVLAPGNGGYTAARVLFNTRFDGIRPPAVVGSANSADVQAVVKWAARYDVPLVARSGGNAYNGSSTSATAVVVDVGGARHRRRGRRPTS